MSTTIIYLDKACYHFAFCDLFQKLSKFAVQKKSANSPSAALICTFTESPIAATTASSPSINQGTKELFLCSYLRIFWGKSDQENVKLKLAGKWAK